MSGERTARNSRLPVELLKLPALFSKQGVSRSWLYSQPDIRDQIQRRRHATGRSAAVQIPASQRASDASLLRRLQAAHAEREKLLGERARLLEERDRLRGNSPAFSASNDRQATPPASRRPDDVQHVPVR